MDRQKAQNSITAIVETPRGSRNKYKFDAHSGRLKLSKVMPEGMIFPYDFGFLPDTRGGDGDPLDVLLLSDAATFPGCEVECRLIGVLKAEQAEEGKKHRNDRIVAVAAASVLYAAVKEISDLDPTLLKQIEAFFVNYQKVRDIGFRVVAREGSRAALDLMRSAKKKAA
jgi:inorganic pyrophosphatase